MVAVAASVVEASVAAEAAVEAASAAGVGGEKAWAAAAASAAGVAVEKAWAAEAVSAAGVAVEKAWAAGVAVEEVLVKLEPVGLVLRDWAAAGRAARADSADRVAARERADSASGAPVRKVSEVIDLPPLAAANSTASSACPATKERTAQVR